MTSLFRLLSQNIPESMHRPCQGLYLLAGSYWKHRTVPKGLKVTRARMWNVANRVHVQYNVSFTIWKFCHQYSDCEHCFRS